MTSREAQARIHAMIEAFVAGAPLDACLSAGLQESDEPNAPPAGDPGKCPACGLDTQMRVGYAWCGSAPPCQAEHGEWSGHAMKPAKVRPRPRARRLRW